MGLAYAGSDTSPGHNYEPALIRILTGLRASLLYVSSMCSGHDKTDIQGGFDAG